MRTPARAIDAGAKGILVSNHGGRQLSRSLATIDALPDVVAGAAGRVEVYVDGGIRTGSDVLVALALGARAAFVGRPAAWGLALGGADPAPACWTRCARRWPTMRACAASPM